jgi:hypothetical protein
MPKKRLPSPAAIAQAKDQLTPAANCALAMLGEPFDGSVEMGEEFAAIAIVLQDKPTLSQADIENRLTLQMTALDKTFYNLLTMSNGAGKLKERLALLEVALKFQQSSRKAGLALDTIRNPKKPTQFIKNYVDKQLNNLAAPSPQAPPNQLTQDDRPHVTILDSRAAGTAAREDSALETVVEVHRSTDNPRETNVQQEFF